MNPGTLIAIIVAAVGLVAAIGLCFKFREKLGKFFRVYKSEAKKVVWLPWNQTWKSSYVVAIVLVVCAVVICVLDYLLMNGFDAFVKLFK